MRCSEWVFGREEIKIPTSRKTARNGCAPSLAKVPFDGSGFVVRYYKGSLMLDWIRNTVGSDQFYSAARDFFQTYKGKSIGTQEFRSFWKQELGEKKDLLDVWLDSTGGLPQVGK